MAEERPIPKVEPKRLEPKSELKHLVRIANTDLNGKKPIGYVMSNIKGVGINFAQAACKVAGIPVNTKTGSLTDAQIKKLDEIVKNPEKAGIPAWFLNRRKEPETGTNKHLLLGELKYTKETDVKILRKIKSYKGVRHGLGLPVRGQRTRSNFRRNKGKVLGVKRVKAGKKQ